MQFRISFYGHENIRSLHQNTIEVTRDSNLTPSGDCIVGIGASCACRDIPDELKERLRDPKRKIQFRIIVGRRTFSFEASGHPGLVLSHPEDIVIRKSGFVCPRTLAVRSDAASDSVPREMIRMLQDPKSVGTLVIDA